MGRIWSYGFRRRYQEYRNLSVLPCGRPQEKASIESTMNSDFQPTM